MNLEDRIGQLVRDVIEPMLSAELSELEDRLATRLEDLVQALAPQRVPPLLSLKDVAAYLGLSERTVQRMVARGELPPPIPVSPGRNRWRLGDLDAWLDRREAP